MENLAKHPTYDPQETLFERFCGEAETLIASAKSKEEAVRIKDELCAKFEKECGSNLVITATRTFVDQIIERNWNHENLHQQNHDG